MIINGHQSHVGLFRRKNEARERCNQARNKDQRPHKRSEYHCLFIGQDRRSNGANDDIKNNQSKELSRQASPQKTKRLPKCVCLWFNLSAARFEQYARDQKLCGTANRKNPDQNSGQQKQTTCTKRRAEIRKHFDLLGNKKRQTLNGRYDRRIKGNDDIVESIQQGIGLDGGFHTVLSRCVQLLEQQCAHIII